MTAARTTVLPGDRVVARGHGVVLVADAPAVGAPPDVVALIEVLAATEPDPMSALAGRAHGPAFAAVTIDDGRARVLFAGAAGAAVTVALYDGAAAGTPSRVLTAADGAGPAAAGAHELALGPGTLVTVTVGPPPVPEHVCGPTALHLLGGAVPGRGAVLWHWAPEGAARTDDADDGAMASGAMASGAMAEENEEPTGEPAMLDKTDLDIEAVTAPVATGGPMVAAVACAFGHPNAPGAVFCRRCGALVDRRAPVISLPRPPLGMLVTDDGQTFVLASDVVLGREPEGFVASRDARAADGGAALVPLRLTDRTSALSRVHVELRLDGWQVLAVDAGSANGTWLRAPGAATPVRLPSGQPVPVPEGATLHVGGRSVLLAPLIAD